MQFNLKKANRYLPYILLIGIGIGTANYFMNDALNWMQWLILSLVTSLLIGYALVSIAANKSYFEHYLKPSWKLYSILFFVFFLIGIMATEVENIIKMFVFFNEEYHPFSAGKMYLFNGVITLVLGFSFFLNKHFFPPEDSSLKESQEDLIKTETEPNQIEEELSQITKVPVKQGENIILIPIEDIAYFEAFDNYSFMYNLKGEKRLCDYSLLFLQKRLGDNFMRIHRKYIVNSNHIKQIKPHSNARFQIEFSIPDLSPILSSKGYSASIRSLIKIR